MATKSLEGNTSAEKRGVKHETIKGIITTASFSISPMLSVRNGAKDVGFYKLAFDAIEIFRMEAPGGKVVSRLSVMGTDFWLEDEVPDHANLSPETLNGGTVTMILTVPYPMRCLPV